MNTDKQLLQRYAITRILIDAVQKTIDNPNKSVADNLSEGDDKSRKMSALLVASGATISTTALSTIAVETAVLGSGATFGAGLAAGAVTGILGGPIVWGGGLFAIILVWIRKMIKRRKEKNTKQPQKEKKRKGKKADEEKTVLLKTIIEKQQAIIDKLSKENTENKNRIHNLEEALRIIQETNESVEGDYAVA